MAKVTVSPKFEVVIPTEVCDSLKLKPGQKLSVIEKNGIIHLIPIRPIRELKKLSNRN
jgi:AbrB family looped-hinge helix DNA binding protein